MENTNQEKIIMEKMMLWSFLVISALIIIITIKEISTKTILVNSLFLVVLIFLLQIGISKLESKEKYLLSFPIIVGPIIFFVFILLETIVFPKITFIFIELDMAIKEIIFPLIGIVFQLVNQHLFYGNLKMDSIITLSILIFLGFLSFCEIVKKIDSFIFWFFKKTNFDERIEKDLLYKIITLFLSLNFLIIIGIQTNQINLSMLLLVISKIINIINIKKRVFPKMLDLVTFFI